ncbi:MAG: zinc ribbon domain-containing protein [Bacteroidetes Order II. Incertae sedis bacterium]|jgi:putative FmdB family regulatory protein|nr:zinc ribbon domain-containing protein [Bacteroidetes Order II. bacterium]MBT4051461.1 zinc ribbon domain-containing protein [Bacteroidetes Order II. bacterium]MBT4602015.1 zinc ribbon domain-containing protein [Bacteroidetes Order II. bacterium]MBT5250357.1 zinc ribbon domain-containing protein [Bacteroidetes Order II. bacterium]MBT6201134.1 zinc ribbon domain-containing protein [Bacteroidetes Order II. bacterium]
MPTYEYKREDGTTFELVQRMSEKPLTECPTTGQKVKRIFSAGSGLVFKGSGFYITDYAKKTSSSSSKSEESKPAPKAAAKEKPSTPKSSD